MEHKETEALMLMLNAVRLQIKATMFPTNKQKAEEYTEAAEGFVLEAFEALVPWQTRVRPKLPPTPS